MARYVLKRLGLALITLLLLSVIVFAAAQLLPGNLGRSVLGRDATEEAVAEYNHEHGTDRPPSSSTSTGLGGVVQGDLGTSLVPPEPPGLGRHRARARQLDEAGRVRVRPRRAVRDPRRRLRRPARREDRPTAAITVVGLSLAVVPEFVTGLVLILVFSIWLGWLPVTAQWEPGAGPLRRSST